jgi:hypothetical protein
MFLADIARIDLGLDSVTTLILWIAIPVLSAILVFTSRRSPHPAHWLIAGVVAVGLAFLLLQLMTTRVLPLPPGPPGRTVVVSDPVAKSLLLASTFLFVPGLVTVLASLIWLWRSKRGSASSTAP